IFQKNCKHFHMKGRESNMALKVGHQMKTKLEPVSKKEIKRRKLRERNKKILHNWQLYIFILPAFLYFLIFHYIPMYGVQIAFKDFLPSLGILKSPWVGFEHFTRFFNSYYFWDLIKNTLGISIYELIVGFPLPIILAL